MYELERADSFAGIMYILLLSRVPLLLEKKKELILFNLLILYMHTQSCDPYLQLFTLNSRGKYQNVLKQLLD